MSDEEKRVLSIDERCDALREAGFGEGFIREVRTLDAMRRTMEETRPSFDVEAATKKAFDRLWETIAAQGMVLHFLMPVAIRHVHDEDGWRIRRRLLKACRTRLGTRTHLAACTRCAARLGMITEVVRGLLPKP